MELHPSTYTLDLVRPKRMPKPYSNRNIKVLGSPKSSGEIQLLSLGGIDLFPRVSRESILPWMQHYRQTCGQHNVLFWV